MFYEILLLTFIENQNSVSKTFSKKIHTQKKLSCTSLFCPSLTKNILPCGAGTGGASCTI